MPYRWEYVRCQVNSYQNHISLKDNVVLSCSRQFLNKEDCIYNALQQGGHYRLDVQVILCIIKEEDQPLSSSSSLTNYVGRLATFRKWPPAIPITPDAMARAGFFYQGIGDRVTCFSCGKSLFSWKTKDNPWSEHKRHSPHCDHLNGPATKDVTGSFNYRGHQGTAEVCDGGDLSDDDNDIEMSDIETKPLLPNH